jgi:hypothetical protein
MERLKGLVCSLVSWGEEETKGKRLESGKRECWCCGWVSVGVQWLRWRKRGALTDSWLREGKEITKMRAIAWFWPGEKIRFRVFCGRSKFFSLKKIVLCQFSSPPSAYGCRFTYIENPYTYYLRKYCNNYCRDYLL